MLNVRPQELRRYASGNPLVGTHERLALGGDGQQASLQYESVQPDARLKIEFVREDEVLIRHEPRGAGDFPAVEFYQPQDGPLRLTIGDGDTARTLTVPSLWHLLLLHRGEAEEHLLPLLEQLRPGWKLAQAAERVEQALFRLAQSGWLPQHDVWRQLVQQLSSPSFRQRQAADRALRAEGQVVLAFLDSLDPSQLDSEQRLRVRRLRESLLCGRTDQPDRVASWLVDDKAVWLQLLAHADPQKRALAVAQLNQICQREIEFDPFAGPDRRQEQLARLTAGIED